MRTISGRSAGPVAGGTRAERDDAVLPATKALALFIIPFLVVAFLVLYPDPTETERWFAWTINPTMTPMVLGAAYLGGAYFFLRVLWSHRWHEVKAGFIPVTLFASSLGIATIMHWDRFNHDHVAFWLWAGLYFTAPFLVAAIWWRNRRQDPGPGGEEPLLPPATRLLMGVVGMAALLSGIFLFGRPAQGIDVWPWELTPLTARVMGSVLMLGVAGVGLARDGRRATARLMLEVAGVMVALILLAALRARDELMTTRPLTWMFGAGLVFVLLSSAILVRRARSGARSDEVPSPR